MTDDAGGSLPPAGWYDDPSGSGGKRYWDGTTWGETAPAPGAAASPPAGGAAGAATPPPQWSPAAPEKKKRGRGCLTALAIAAVVIIGIIIIVTVASSGGDDDDSASSSASDDGKSQVEEVTVTSCDAPDAIGVVYAKGAAENTSSKRSDYIIEVTVETPTGDQIGTGTAFAENVAAGQSAQWSALTDTDSADWVDGSVCKVVDVERNESL